MSVLYAALERSRRSNGDGADAADEASGPSRPGQDAAANDPGGRVASTADDADAAVANIYRDVVPAAVRRRKLRRWAVRGVVLLGLTGGSLYTTGLLEDSQGRLSLDDLVAKLGEPSTYQESWESLQQPVNAVVDSVARNYDRIVGPYRSIDTETDPGLPEATATSEPASGDGPDDDASSQSDDPPGSEATELADGAPGTSQTGVSAGDTPSDADTPSGGGLKDGDPVAEARGAKDAGTTTRFGQTASEGDAPAADPQPATDGINTADTAEDGPTATVADSPDVASAQQTGSPSPSAERSSDAATTEPARTGQPASPGPPVQTASLPPKPGVRPAPPERSRGRAGRDSAAASGGSTPATASAVTRADQPEANEGSITSATYRRAASAVRSGSPDRGAQLYLKILNVRPDDVNALFGLGWALQKAGLPSEAARTYREVLQAEPGHREALSNLVAIYVGMPADQAVTELTRLANANAGFASVHAQLAQAHAELGAYDQAIARMQRAVALASGQLSYRYNLAVLYDRAGRSGAAVEAYRDVLRRAQARAGASGLPTEAIRRRLTYLRQ